MEMNQKLNSNKPLYAEKILFGDESGSFQKEKNER